MSHRDVFRAGLDALFQLQKELRYLPRRKEIPKLIDKIVKQTELNKDSRERYFRLLAACALRGQEKMYFNFKYNRRKSK